MKTTKPLQKSWSRHQSDYEKAAIKILEGAGKPLTIREIVERIIARRLVDISGKTPEKTLYALIYKKERLRKSRGQPLLFKKIRKGNSVFYSLR